ncbi:MAG TPA: hypothetical protein VF384_08350 [Planctomycetota bacterium]
MVLTAERGSTSQDRLRIDWKHPVPPAGDAGTTSAVSALPLADALKVLWENDERPLLVLRECSFCQDTDLALLSSSQSNDRTILMTKWFRVVRLPPHVTEPHHAFYNAFAGYSFKGSPHFYLLATPYSQPVEFTGQQTQTSLWKGMHSVIAERYSRDPAKAVKEWLTLLERFDRLDALIRSTQMQLDEARASSGPDSERAKGLQKRLADAKKEHGEALAREEKLRDLGLLPMPKAQKVASAEK